MSIGSAIPAECRLVEGVLCGSFLDELPGRLIGDKVHDADDFDEQFQIEYRIELIAPNGCKLGKTQDGIQSGCLKILLRCL